MKRFLGLISFLLLQATCIGKDAGMLRATHDVQERIEGDINFLQVKEGEVVVRVRAKHVYIDRSRSTRRSM